MQPCIFTNDGQFSEPTVNQDLVIMDSGSFLRMVFDLSVDGVKNEALFRIRRF
jgi:hypothetical protein